MNEPARIANVRHTNLSLCAVEYFPVNVPGYESVKLMAHRPLDEVDGWMISEWSSGASVSTGMHILPVPSVGIEQLVALIAENVKSEPNKFGEQRLKMLAARQVAAYGRANNDADYKAAS